MLESSKIHWNVITESTFFHLVDMMKLTMSQINLNKVLLDKWDIDNVTIFIIWLMLLI
jgi:hypothetical protein